MKHEPDYTGQIIPEKPEKSKEAQVAGAMLAVIFTISMGAIMLAVAIKICLVILGIDFD